MSDAAMSPALDVPVLAAQAARIAVADTTSISELTLSTHGARVLMVGATESLMASLTGVPMNDGGGARVVAGSLLLLGRDVARGDHREVAGLMAFEPPMPMSWNAAEYLHWRARLRGISEGMAAAVHAVLNELELERLLHRRLDSLNPEERRALRLAAALLGEPAVLVLDQPLRGLDERAAAWLLELLARATAERAAIVSIADIAPGSMSGELANSASDVCLLRDGQLLLHADPRDLFAEARVFELTVRSHADELRDALERRGIELRGGPKHFWLSAPANMGVGDVLHAASEARAAVVSCVPLLG
jgi:ABC-type multidrug transport system ATPase subunit